MPKVKALVRGGGMWPDAPPHAHQAPRSELTVAARRLAESVVAELKAHGVVISLDDFSGRAKFRAARRMSIEARRLVETRGDLVEALLREKEASR